ncbi:MAG: hypothetical protein HYY13_10090 [Nitrospirae bacterium]|nr:hypothetical protein [Nitrospirota bacterium]
MSAEYRGTLYLPRRSHEALKARSVREKVSLADLVRRAVDAFLQQGEEGTIAEGYRQLESMVGIGRGDGAAVAERHDEFVAQAIARERGVVPRGEAGRRPSNPAAERGRARRR